ncbi:MAG: T9SS type A sorting domain-containing protein [Saprospiraceae bacterium]|nr:T9SS type A sorting domain-containing protein [Saprospiraceae bacterium]
MTTTWETASEINNNYFEIQRSRDGRDFEAIGNVKGKGTTNDRQFYQFEDTEPAQGINYYRLRQVDFDGRNELSKTVSVSFGSAAEKIKIYPTVVENSLNVTIEGQLSREILVRDITGRILLTQKPSKDHQMGLQTLVFDLSSFSSGTYFLSILTARGVETSRFLKL